MMRSFVCIICLFLLSPNLWSAEVLKVKGKSVLIDLKGESAVKGDLFYVLRNGKRAGILRIGKVKGDKGIARLLKGKAEAGMQLEYRERKGSVTKRAASPSTVVQTGPSGTSYWGALVGMSRTSMSVKMDFQGEESVALAGNAFSVKGLFDYEIFNKVWFRGTSGLEGFSATGPSRCPEVEGTTCDASINYLSFDFLGRYVFSSGKIRPWIGGGVGLLFPMTKKASALDAASISTTNVIVVGGGLDWFTSPTFYIPLSIEYGLLPKSDEVQASWMALRAGFAVPF